MAPLTLFPSILSASPSIPLNLSCLPFNFPHSSFLFSLQSPSILRVSPSIFLTPSCLPFNPPQFFVSPLQFSSLLPVFSSIPPQFFVSPLQFSSLLPVFSSIPLNSSCLPLDSPQSFVPLLQFSSILPVSSSILQPFTIIFLFLP